MERYKHVTNDLRFLIRSERAIVNSEEIISDPKFNFLEANYVEKMVHLYWAEPRVQEVLTSIFRRMLFVYTEPKDAYKGEKYMHQAWYSAFIKYDVLMQDVDEELASSEGKSEEEKERAEKV